MSMLICVKQALRIDGNEHDNEHDDEIQGLIDAARADMALSGVHPDKTDDDEDPLIKRAIITYCRAEFDYADQSAERLREAYESLKRFLSLTEEYRGGGK